MTELLTDEQLMRNVAIGHFDPDALEPTPAAFWPHKSDQGQLSTDRSGIWTPEQSFKHRTKVLEKPSRGVVTLTTDELEGLKLSSQADPIVDEPKNPAHALVDFSDRLDDPPTDRRILRETLANIAVGRGWAHGPVLK